MDNPESDYHNFSQTPSSAHRLPTLNGAQALINTVEKHQPISTSLVALDSVICESNPAVFAGNGGLVRGVVTEIYGAPGSGKTHFAIQLAVNVLKKQNDAKVVWVDTSSQLPLPRLQKFMRALLPQQSTESLREDEHGQDEPQKSPVNGRFKHFHISSFTHLLSMLLHPSDSLVPPETTLLVVDDFSSLVTHGLPHDERAIGANRASKTSLSREDIVSRSMAGRRAAMLNAISSGIARLAATHNLALVVLNKATSNRKMGGKNAMLRSVLSSTQWNENINTRIVLYRRFWPKIDMSHLSRADRRKQRRRETHALRVAEVERRGGQEIRAEGVKFVILNTRLQAVDRPKAIPVTVTSTNAIMPSSPPLHSDDNDEAMGQLGLEDTAGYGDEDRSVQMPEDMPPQSPSSDGAPSSQSASGPGKRKLAEIADSEDEEEIEVGVDVDADEKKTTSPRKLANTTVTAAFLLSSQLTREDSEPDDRDTNSNFPSTNKGAVLGPKADANTNGKDDRNDNDDDDDDEMLIQD